MTILAQLVNRLMDLHHQNGKVLFLPLLTWWKWFGAKIVSTMTTAKEFTGVT